MTDPSVHPRDIVAAFRFLTRLPLPESDDKDRSASAVWAFPLVGLAIGAAAGLLAWLLVWLGLPRGAAAIIALACMIVVTGGLHEDGLSDCADGFGGGKDKAKILEIMRDSRIGTYGALALILVILTRYESMAYMRGWDLVLNLAVVGAMSRALMGGLMYALPHARSDGASASFGRPDAMTAAIGLGIAVLAAVLLTGISGGLLVGFMALPAVGMMMLAQAKLEGQTGDVLGCTQQICEAFGLIMAVTLL